MKNIYFHTLGCRLNQAEGVLLQGLLREKGFRVTEKMADAGIVVINSCTVTDSADTDTRRLVNRVQRENPKARIAIIGCQAQVQKEQLLKMPLVEWVIGTERKMQLAEILSSDSNSTPLLSVPVIRRQPFTMSLTASAGNRVRANLKIQDGCDNFCAYCEIPFARGRTRSRLFADILAEARALVGAGHKEIVLTGINVGMYAYGGKSLIDVVEGLHRVHGLERIRISSIEHPSLPLDLTRFMFPKGKLCRFLHIPIQSGSDRILRRMGRGYTTTDYADMAKLLLKRVPGIMIGTDVIVGFPGETEADFLLTQRLLEELPVRYFHVFGYSDRQRARSRTFKRQVPRDVVERRSSALRKLSAEKRRHFLSSQIGLVEPVLFEQKKNHYWIGHTDNYVTIKMRLEEDIKNRILDVRMEHVAEQSIIGSLNR